jgi:hypothetical protein
VARYLEPIARLEVVSKALISSEVQLSSLRGDGAVEDDPRIKHLAATVQSQRVERLRLEEAIVAQHATEEPTLHRLREDAAVSSVGALPVSDGDPEVFVLLFGGRHEFLSVVERFNKEHRDRPIALVEITPQGYIE